MIFVIKYYIKSVILVFLSKINEIMADKNELQTELLEDINKVLLDHLPMNTCNIIKDRLKWANEAEKTINALEADNKRLRDEVISLEEENKKISSEIDTFNKRKKELDEKELELEARERNIELEITKILLAESDKRADEMHGIVQTVFKSPVYRRSMNKTETIGGQTCYGNDGVPHFVRNGMDSSTMDETISED